MEKYKLKASLWRELYDNFKVNQYSNLLSFINGCRILDYIRFSSFGNISFEESDKETKWNPICVELDQYNRNKTNALIFDIIHTRYNSNCDFDKIIIYQDIYPKSEYYGYYLYNTKTGKSIQHHTIDKLDDELIRHITKMFHTYEKLYLRI